MSALAGVAKPLLAGRGKKHIDSNADAALVALARPSFPDLLWQRKGASGSNLSDEFGFVPEFLLAVLMSHDARTADLKRVLQIDWVRRWYGWREFERDVDGVDNDEIKAGIAAEYVQRFGRLVLQNVDLDVKSDEARRRELTSAGKRMGRGLVHGENDCCADSLLQLLAYHGYVNAELSASVIARKAATACRAHLV